MSLFEYVMVLFSVVLSLGLALLMTDLAKLIRAGSRVRWSFVFVLWMIAAVSIHLDLWTSLWDRHDADTWSFAAIVLTLASSAFIYLSVALLMPELKDDQALDLGEWHQAQRLKFLPAFMGYTLSIVAFNVVVLQWDWEGWPWIAANLVLLALAIRFPNRWVQRLAPMVILAIDTRYFLTHYATMA